MEKVKEDALNELLWFCKTNGKIEGSGDELLTIGSEIVNKIIKAKDKECREMLESCPNEDIDEFNDWRLSQLKKIK